MVPKAYNMAVSSRSLENEVHITKEDHHTQYLITASPPPPYTGET